MSVKDGGQAFPCVFRIGQGENGLDGQPVQTPQQHIVLGMSLRDWFAGQALAGMVSNHQLIEKQVETHGPSQVEANITRIAYVMADAMIAARDRE